MRYPSSCWFLLALILEPSANSSRLLYSFTSSMVAEPAAAAGCGRAVRVPAAAAAAAAERCMEPGLKWRRKRSGRRLRPPFIAAPPANREGCWAVTWRGVRRAPCRAALEASEGRSGASCRGARGRQWERLREARVAGAEGNNGGGGGAWESRGGTSIAGRRGRREVAPGGRAQEWSRSNPTSRRSRGRGVAGRGHGPAWPGSSLLVSRVPVRPTRVLRPQSVPQGGDAGTARPPARPAGWLAGCSGPKGGVHPARLAEEAAARALARPVHACSVPARAGSGRAESGRAMTPPAPVLAEWGAVSAQAPSAAGIAAARVRAASRAG